MVNIIVVKLYIKSCPVIVSNWISRCFPLTLIENASKKRILIVIPFSGFGIEIFAQNMRSLSSWNITYALRFYSTCDVFTFGLWLCSFLSICLRRPVAWNFIYCICIDARCAHIILFCLSGSILLTLIHFFIEHFCEWGHRTSTQKRYTSNLPSNKGIFLFWEFDWWKKKFLVCKVCRLRTKAWFNQCPDCCSHG